MKSQTVFLAALSFALSLTASAAPADAATVPVTLDSFFAELAAGCAASASSAVAGAPADAIFLTGCTAQNDCTNFGGVPISCQGSGPFGSSCTVGLCWVSCDGQTTYCCDISALACPHRACAYCACIAEGIFSPSECSDQACSIDPDP